MSTRRVIIRLDGYAARTTELMAVNVPKSTRMYSTLRSAGIFWSCAFAAIFVPMLHFVLVPAFILAGFFFAANSYLDDERLQIKNPVSCGKCDGLLVLVNDNDVFPKWARCEKCQVEHRFDLNRE